MQFLIVPLQNEKEAICDVCIKNGRVSKVIVRMEESSTHDALGNAIMAGRNAMLLCANCVNHPIWKE